LKEIAQRKTNVELRVGMATGRGGDEFRYLIPIPIKKKSSPSSPYPNLTGIKLLSHPHPHRVTGITHTHTCCLTT